MEQDAKRMLLEYNRETKRLDDLYRCAAKQCGISECAFWILYTLRAEERQFTQAEICEFLIEPKQTVHSALKKLEAEGYLARTSGADLRSKRVALTEKGEQFARAWIDRVLEAEAAALCAMPEAERAAFVWGLHSFCRLLEERLLEALRARLGDGEVVHTSFSSAQRDGRLEVTLQAECTEEIGRFVPLEPITEENEAEP